MIQFGTYDYNLKEILKLPEARANMPEGRLETNPSGIEP